MKPYPVKPSKQYHRLRVDLSSDELRRFKAMSAELGSYTITIASALLRASFDPANREYIADIVRQAERAKLARKLESAT